MRLLMSPLSMLLCCPHPRLQSLYTAPGTHEIILNRRKGFVKVALLVRRLSTRSMLPPCSPACCPCCSGGGGRHDALLRRTAV